MELKDNARMREQLESAMGLTLAEIVELAKRWPTVTDPRAKSR